MKYPVEFFFIRPEFSLQYFFYKHPLETLEQPPHPVQKSVERSNTFTTPGTPLLEFKTEHQSTTESIRSIFFKVFFRIHHISPGFPHPQTIRPLDDSLLAQGLERFSIVYKIKIMQYHGDKSGIEQVHGCMLRTTHIHIYRAPFIH